MPTSEFTGDDKPALDYIRKRGYASYSSIKNVRDCVVPSVSNEAWFKFGHELHSRDLEKNKLSTLSEEEEKTMAAMLIALDRSKVYQSIKRGADFEIDFGPQSVLDKYDSKNGLLVPTILGLPVYGRIDILKKRKHISDLKSTRHTSMKAFAESMDFLQAVLYMKAAKVDDFYYVGISKQAPYVVLPFSVKSYPARLAAAESEMVKLLMYIKSQL